MPERIAPFFGKLAGSGLRRPEVLRDSLTPDEIRFIPLIRFRHEKGTRRFKIFLVAFFSQE